MAYVSRALRQLVTARAGGLCEYCHTAQAIVIEQYRRPGAAAMGTSWLASP